MAMKDLDS